MLPWSGVDIALPLPPTWIAVENDSRAIELFGAQRKLDRGQSYLQVESNFVDRRRTTPQNSDTDARIESASVGTPACLAIFAAV